jgi:MFS family permease
MLAGLYSFGLFLPTIIAGLGYTAHEAQLWSVIPYAVAACVTLFVSFLSDKLQIRGVMMLCTLPLAIIGYAVIANTTNPSVKYAMTFLMASGLYSSIPPSLGWLSNNSAGHYKRATSIALLAAIGNCGGFVTVFVYPAAEGPHYHKGHTIILGLEVAAWFMCVNKGPSPTVEFQLTRSRVLLNVLYCWKINRDKRAGKYDHYIGCGDDRDPEFKMIL